MVTCVFEEDKLRFINRITGRKKAFNQVGLYFLVRNFLESSEVKES